MGAHYRKAMFVAVMALSLSLVPFAAVAHAQGRPTAPDLSGFWINQYTPDLSRALGAQPPFTAEGAERWRTVDTARDPTSRCLPPGPSRAFTAPYPFVLVQQPAMIAILFEYFGIWRLVYLDGRGHPDSLADFPDFMGHSVGRWDGDTLVVDTVGVNGRAWLDTAGHEHSDKLRLTERFRRNGDEITWTVTFDDPVFFERPWSITRTFTRGKPTDRILPYTCTENNKDIEHLTPNQPNLGYKHQPGR